MCSADILYNRCRVFSATTFCQVLYIRHSNNILSGPVRQTQQQHSVRSCTSDTATNIYDSDNLSLQTQPEQLTSRLRLEPRTCQAQSSSKDLTLTMRAHRYLFLQMLVFVSATYTHISNNPDEFVSIQISCYLSL